MYKSKMKADILAQVNRMYPILLMKKEGVKEYTAADYVLLKGPSSLETPHRAIKLS